jgi:Leucine Rich repeat
LTRFTAQAEILRYGREKVQLTHLEFMDCGVGPVGCLALGESVMMGANRSLLTLRLDNNPSIGDEGIIELCKGLRTNKTLKVCVVVAGVEPSSH